MGIRTVPMTVRVEVRSLATIARWLEENRFFLRNRSDIVREALIVLAASLERKGQAFDSNAEALEWLVDRGLFRIDSADGLERRENKKTFNSILGEESLEVDPYISRDFKITSDPASSKRSEASRKLHQHLLSSSPKREKTQLVAGIERAMMKKEIEGYSEDDLETVRRWEELMQQTTNGQPIPKPISEEEFAQREREKLDAMKSAMRLPPDPTD